MKSAEKTIIIKKEIHINMEYDYIIQTNDGKEIPIRKTDLEKSEFIRTVMESCSEDDRTIPLPNVSSETLENVLCFTRHYEEAPMKKIPKPLPSANLEDVLDPWYVKYITSIGLQAPLYDLLRAANYLDIPPLQDIACARVASLIRGKDASEMKKVLGIE